MKKIKNALAFHSSVKRIEKKKCSSKNRFYSISRSAGGSVTAVNQLWAPLSPSPNFRCFVPFFQSARGLLPQRPPTPSNKCTYLTPLPSAKGLQSCSSFRWEVKRTAPETRRATVTTAKNFYAWQTDRLVSISGSECWTGISVNE